MIRFTGPLDELYGRSIIFLALLNPDIAPSVQDFPDPVFGQYFSWQDWFYDFAMNLAKEHKAGAITAKEAVEFIKTVIPGGEQE